jgi:16S rRNA processing protein RimM
VGGASRPARRVLLGRVLGAHGIRGRLRVRWLGDGPENLLRMPEVALGRDPDDPDAPCYEVQAAEPGRPGEVRLALRGVTEREAAEALKGRLVLGAKEHLRPLGPGEHYEFELVGCRVETTEGTQVGVVREIWPTPAHDVLVVEGADGRRHLLPAAEALLRRVDVEEKRIVLELPAGLLDPV